MAKGFATTENSNLIRVLNIVGVKPLIAAIVTCSPTRRCFSKRESPTAYALAKIRRRLALVLLAGPFLALGLGGPAFGLDLFGLPVVFFDWGSSDLTPTMKKILVEDRSLIKKSSRVYVLGHCDTSEQSPDALSLSRAEAVKKFFVAAGVSEASIVVVGRSTDDKMAPTPVNTREPQNRYVAIDIR